MDAINFSELPRTDSESIGLVTAASVGQSRVTCHCPGGQGRPAAAEAAGSEAPTESLQSRLLPGGLVRVRPGPRLPLCPSHSLAGHRGRAPGDGPITQTGRDWLRTPDGPGPVKSVESQVGPLRGPGHGPGPAGPGPGTGAVTVTGRRGKSRRVQVPGSSTPESRPRFKLTASVASAAARPPGPTGASESRVSLARHRGIMVTVTVTALSRTGPPAGFESLARSSLAAGTGPSP